MSETLPIHEYIAEKWGPRGKNPCERAKINMLAQVVQDLKNTFTNNCYDGNLEAALEGVRTKLPPIVNFLGDKKFLVTELLPSYIDFYFFEVVQAIQNVKNEVYNEYPTLGGYV